MNHDTNVTIRVVAVIVAVMIFIALLAVYGSRQSVRDGRLQHQCQDQRGYWDVRNGVCVFGSVPAGAGQ